MQELADRILQLYSLSAPNSTQLMEIFSDYHIARIDRHGKKSFQKQIEIFLGAKRSEGLSHKSISNYKLYLCIAADYFRMRLEDVTTNDIRAFISHLHTERGMKNSSVQSVINILGSFFGWMTQEEIIAKNPMLKIKSIRIDRKNARHPLTTEELEVIRNACRDYREKAIVEFLYSTGCRLSEATQIDVSRINFEQRSVHVIGKGSKGRTLYFSIRARLMLTEYLRTRRGGTALFVTSRKPYDRLSERAIQKMLVTLGERAGLERRVHPHIFRHTFATDCLNAGMDITVIQQLLGHGNVGTTQIYAEINQENVRREYDKYIS